MAKPKKSSPVSAKWLHEAAMVPSLEDEVRIIEEGGKLPRFRLRHEDRLSEFEALIQECSALSTPGPFAGMRAAMFRTMLRLQRGANVYRGESERKGAKIQLEAVLLFLNLFQSLSSTADAPLRALLRGLYCLDQGAVEPMLRPKQVGRGRPTTLQSMELRGLAAAAVELMCPPSTQDSACKLVANRLDSAGYRIADATGPGTITKETVYAWRREVLRRKADSPMRQIFDQALGSGARLDSTSSINAFFSRLQSWVPAQKV